MHMSYIMLLKITINEDICGMKKKKKTDYIMNEYSQKEKKERVRK